MTLGLEFGMTPRFGLEVSPALVAFGELLMLPYGELQRVVDDELLDNPALERLEAHDCPVCRGGWSTRCPACGGGRAGGGPGGVFGEPPDHAVAEPDTPALLRAVRMETDARDAPIVEYLVGCLDEHGLLDRPPARLAAELGVEEAAVARVLAVVRAVGPPGVGATGVAECLLLQLDALGRTGDEVALARAVIADHLPALARGRFAAIAAALGCRRVDVADVLDLVRTHLRPYPAFQGTGRVTACPVVPDVVVREHGDMPGEFTVELVEPALTRLRVRPGGPPGGQAGAFLGRLHDRWETLRRVAEYAVARQRDFLAAGPTALRPLTRAEVAAALDLHESTVSRTVADKWALLPTRTIVPLSTFFPAGGGLDAALRGLLESADGRVSDQCLADRLCAAGFPVARRTVTKHRARLGYTAAALR